MSDNIHVAIRVRPLIKREIEKNAELQWDIKDSTALYQKNAPQAIMYCFDRVFSMDAGNSLVYQDLCAPIVRSVMEGFNGTIFAYGQTSSGKTYTMMGEYGIIPSAIHDIFDAIDNMPEREFLLRVSYMEIYNENVLDLLSSDPKSLKTLEDTDGVIFVAGLEEVEIKTSEEVFRVMKRGERGRRVGETNMNQKSSRSHAIFRMIVESRMRNADIEDSVVNVGQLNLVDLAGSERSGQMGSTGERFREGIHINKSLFMLTQVISQLSKGEKQYVGYRDSKLTRILQNSLGGNARTVIICNITLASGTETLSTLKFASRAKKIKNKPTANVVSNDKALLKRYTNEIKTLSEKLEALQQLGDDGKKEILVKELEEKSKQNEDLKQQIQELKEKFVVSQLTTDRSYPIHNKKSRRETWCAGRSGLARLNSQTECGRGLVNQLSILQEEPLNSSSFPDLDFETLDCLSSTISPSYLECPFTLNRESNTEVSVQTEDNYFSKERLLETLRTAQEEYRELQEFTTREKQAQEVFNTEEIKLLKVKNQELQMKLSEYDDLLHENNKQRNRINDLSQEIEKLVEQNHGLQATCEQQERNFGILCNSGMASLSSPNELSVFEEFQQSEPKTFQDVGIQAEEVIACIQTHETVQTEDNQLQTINNLNRHFGKVHPENVNEGSDAKSRHLISMDDMIFMEQSLENTLLKCDALLSNIQSLNENIMNSEEPCTIMESNDLDNFSMDDRKAFMSQLFEQYSLLKEEAIIDQLEHTLKMTKIDNDCNKVEITRLENLCNEKDYELKISTEKLTLVEEKLLKKDDELKTWRETASKKYDLLFAERETLQQHLMELKETVAHNEKFIKKLQEISSFSDSHYSKLKDEFLKTLKSLEIAKHQLATNEDDFNSKIRAKELDNEKLKKEALMFKEDAEACIEHYKSAIESSKFNYEQRISALENGMKDDYEEKLASLQKTLDEQHTSELEDLRENLRIEIFAQSQAFKLEKVKFEEKLLSDNRDYVQKNSQYLTQLKKCLCSKEAECEKLTQTIKNFELKKHGDLSGDGISHLNKQLASKQKELTDHRSIISILQKKLAFAEKSAVRDTKTEENADLENLQELEKKNQILQGVIKEQENMIKHHSSKFSTFKMEFEKEYMKLKAERSALAQQNETLKADIAQLKQSSMAEVPTGNKQTSENVLKDSNADSIKVAFENKQLQHRCKKLEQERGILFQKLALCKNEIRRLHDQNNESKIITKSKPEVTSPSSASTASNLHYQTILNQKERCIKRLEKENNQYKDYLKLKGHHKIVQDVQVSDENTAIQQRQVLSTPNNSTTEQSASAVKIASATPPVVLNHTMSRTDEKKKISSFQIDSLPKRSSSATKATVLDLQYDNQNCKQQ